MPVRRRVDKRRLDLPDEAIDWLHDGDGGTWIYFHQEDLVELWHAHGEAIVAEHVAESPGTRPVRWWEYSAPRAQPGDYRSTTRFHDGLPQPRHRLGGSGTPSFEVLANAPRFWCGVPLDWIGPLEVEFYSRLADDFAGISIDPDDLPTYEAQAAYLERLGLLLAGERRRLKPADFAPESILETALLG